MKKITIIVLFVAIFNLGSSCSLFETREPEEPNVDVGNFVPPTTPNILINNLVEAFNNKNVNNYSACFSTNKFVFLPTSEVIAKYPSLFQNWNIESEKRYWTSAIASMHNESKPNLEFTNQEFDFISTDSALFVTDYIISCDFQLENISNKYGGRANFTITNEENGLWAITHWQDFKKKGKDNIPWSQMKASLAN